MTVKITPVGSTEGRIQVGSGLPIEIDTAGNLSTPGNVRAAPATADGDVVTFEQAFGVGQSWQNMTASRATDVVYVNTTSKPIQIAIELTPAVAGQFARLRMGPSASPRVTYAIAWAERDNNIALPAVVIGPGDSYEFTMSALMSFTWWEYR